MIDNNHFHNHIYPLLRHDLEHHTKVISIDKWVEYILGVPPSKLSYWKTYLRDEHLLVDFVITKNMESYCTAQVDRDRHGPWATIVNRIFSISRKYIQTLGQSPLPDLFFVPNNSAIIIEGRPPYAQPDMLVVSRPTLPKLPHNSAFNEDASGITWNHIISCAQFRTGVEHTLLEVYSNWQSSVAPAGKSISPYQKRKRRVAGLGGPPHVTIPSTPISAPVPSMGRLSTLSSHSSRKRKHSLTTFPILKRAKMDEEDDHSEPEDILQTVEEQAASHALEMLANTGGTRSHCLQLTIDGPELQFWYYDSGGVIRSESMDWIKEFSKFAAIMVAFASLDASGWGVGIPNLVPPRSQSPALLTPPTSLTGYSLTMPYCTREDGEDVRREVQVLLEKEILTQYSLVGRRTTVYEVSTTPRISSVPLILKMSMQCIFRTPDYELLNDATAKGVQHLPKALMWTERKTEWRLSHGRVWGKIFPDNEGGKEYEDRCQRIIIFPKYTPIKHVLRATNLHSIFMQLIDCLDQLRYKANMLHRDISLNNLMCEYREGSVWLILNDFDLATRVDDTGMPMGDGLSERQMGTLPFMSLDVLANVTASPHCLWHDLESAFWVALWCLVTLPRSKDADEEKTRRATLLDWERGGLKAIRNTKGAIFARYQELDALPLTPEMQPYRPWIALFWRVFSLAYANINDRKTRAILPKYAGYGEVEPILEPETLDGAVSCAGVRKDLSIWEALDSGEVEGFIRYSPTL